MLFYIRMVTLYPKAAIHGQACKVELTPFTTLLSILTELDPHSVNEGRYETLVGADIFCAASLILEEGEVVRTEFVGGVVIIPSDVSFTFSVVIGISVDWLSAPCNPIHHILKFVKIF